MEYFNSTLEPTHGNLLGIFGIEGPDQMNWPQNNSAYTNTIARISMEFPYYLKNTFNVSGETPDPSYRAYAEKIYVPFDEAQQYHPEYDGYVVGGAYFML